MTSPRAVPERMVTADIWADNWFALYVNGALVKEDSVPISTERSFNAETVTFTTPWPAQVALVVKDYKADDTGLEYIGTPQQQMGDGGVIAQFRDAQTGEVLAVTDASAQVYVTHHAPLESACAQEVKPTPGTGPCGFKTAAEPVGWTGAGFNDQSWSAATPYTPAEVRPKGGYDQIEWVGAAHLIWSADLVKDNTVLIRLGQRPLAAQPPPVATSTSAP